MAENQRSFAKLRGKIVEICGSQREFAERIGLSEQSVVAKLSGRTQLSMDDIALWANTLDISIDEIGTYFFAEKLQNG